MNQQNSSIRQSATFAGISILIMTVAATISTDLTIGSLRVAGNPEATLQNIQDNFPIFLTGLLGWVVILICDIIAAWALYIFFKPTNSGLSLLGGWLRMIYAAMLAGAIFKLSEVLVSLDSLESIAALQPTQIATSVYLAIEGFYTIWSIGLIIFGLHILVLGYLALRSGYVPRVWGVLLLLAAVGYFFVHLMKLAIPQYADFIRILEYIFILPMMSEVALGIWLLVKGRRVHVSQSE